MSKKMGIRLYFNFKGIDYCCKLRQSFYWEHIEELDNSKENKNTSIWLKYIELTNGECSTDMETIKLMTSHWDEITNWDIY